MPARPQTQQANATKRGTLKKAVEGLLSDEPLFADELDDFLNQRKNRPCVDKVLTNVADPKDEDPAPVPEVKMEETSAPMTPAEQEMAERRDLIKKLEGWWKEKFTKLTQRPVTEWKPFDDLQIAALMAVVIGSLRYNVDRADHGFFSTEGKERFLNNIILVPFLVRWCMWISSHVRLYHHCRSEKKTYTGMSKDRWTNMPSNLKDGARSYHPREESGAR